jgi:hypothetical protein
VKNILILAERGCFISMIQSLLYTTICKHNLTGFKILWLLNGRAAGLELNLPSIGSMLATVL